MYKYYVKVGLPTSMRDMGFLQDTQRAFQDTLRMSIIIPSIIDIVLGYLAFENRLSDEEYNRVLKNIWTIMFQDNQELRGEFFEANGYIHLVLEE